VFVNLFRGTVGAPMRLDAVNELVGAAARRAGIDPPPRPHQLRHAFASNVLDAGGTLEEAQDLLGHGSIASTQVYANSRVLHQVGEKPQVTRSRRCRNGVPGLRGAAI
jgi:integrase/recombinase XerD